MEEETKNGLQIDMLHERHIGLTESISGGFLESAAVCFNRHHVSPVEIKIKAGTKNRTRTLEFTKPDVRTLRAWANDIDTTENGAYGVSLAAVEVEEGLVVVSRAETHTGADWYVAPIGAEPEDLEQCYRLEVSGVDSGNYSEIARRLNRKIDQTRKGSSNLPAIASVVGFKELVVLIHKVDESK